MAITDRQSLEAMIRAFIGRLEGDDDFDPFVANLIQLFEATVRPELKTRLLKTRVALPMTDPIPLPSDYREMISVMLLDGSSVLQRELVSWSTKQEVQGRLDGGDAISYVIIGANLHVSPYPGSGFIELTYYAHPVLGPDPGDTNVILLQYPNLYLYGTLLQTAPFLAEDERMGTWEQFYGKALSSINEESNYGEGGTPQISMPS